MRGSRAHTPSLAAPRATRPRVGARLRADARAEPQPPARSSRAPSTASPNPTDHRTGADEPAPSDRPPRPRRRPAPGARRQRRRTPRDPRRRRSCETASPRRRRPARSRRPPNQPRRLAGEDGRAPPGSSPTAATRWRGRCGARSSRCTAATPATSRHLKDGWWTDEAQTETLCALAVWRAEIDDHGRDPREELAFHHQLADYAHTLRQQGGGVDDTWHPGAPPPDWSGS